MANLPDVPDESRLRASDADRERVAALLREAASEGRLELSELDERLAGVYAAKTYADLEPLIADLPAQQISERAAQRRFDEIAVGRIPRLAVAFMSGFNKRGAWAVPRDYTAVTVMGGGHIDLREARFVEGEVTIRVFAFMGGVEIIVPEYADVHVDGIGIMGGFGHPKYGDARATTPRIRVTGVALMGGVDVKRKRPQNRELGGE